MKFSMSFSKPGAGATGPAKAKPGAFGVSVLSQQQGLAKAKAPAVVPKMFQEAIDAQENLEAERIKQGYHPTIIAHSAVAAVSSSSTSTTVTTSTKSSTAAAHIPGVSKNLQKQMDAMIAADASVFQYDEHLDDAEMEKKYHNMQTTDALEQVKRTGLTVMNKKYHEELAQKKSQYVEGMRETKDRRDVEKAILEQRAINRTLDAEEKKPEAFVTGAYARELEKRKKFEAQLLEQDQADEAAFAKNAKAAWGFSGELHQRLLNERRGEGAGGAEEQTKKAFGDQKTTAPGEEPAKPPAAGVAVGPARPPGMAAAPAKAADNMSALGPQRPPGLTAGPQKATDKMSTMGAAKPDDPAAETTTSTTKRDAEKDVEGSGDTAKRPKLEMQSAEASLAQKQQEAEEKRVRAEAAAAVEKEKEAERQAQQQAEKVERNQRALSAKERYLARKNKQ
ncbi:unnamed protein product [Amoebophrya sp. A120]|nr:unnamed protein product [Amoebophrya sp. A120]|eukprot:GSA120T00002338001.1